MNLKMRNAFVSECSKVVLQYSAVHLWQEQFSFWMASGQREGCKLVLMHLAKCNFLSRENAIHFVLQQLSVQFWVVFRQNSPFFCFLVSVYARTFCASEACWWIRGAFACSNLSEWYLRNELLVKRSSAEKNSWPAFWRSLVTVLVMSPMGFSPLAHNSTKCQIVDYCCLAGEQKFDHELVEDCSGT